MRDGEQKPGLCDFGPVARPDAGLLLEIVQGEIEAMVQGGTFHENPRRLERLATWQTTIVEALADDDERIRAAEDALGKRLAEEKG